MRSRFLGGFVLSLMLVTIADQPIVYGQPKAKPSFQAAAKKYFPNWDTDKNGELSVAELDAVLTNPKVKGEAAAFAAVLHQAASPGKKKDTPPVINKDFLAAPPLVGKRTYDDLLAGALNRVHKADRRLFALGGPKLDSIHQGGVGDCFALAPLGAFMARDPKAVSKMMTELPNGKIRVVFADKTLEVPPLTDGEFAIAGGSSENTGCWVRVYEKALGMYRLELRGEAAPKALASDNIAHGGNQGTVIAALTGHACEQQGLLKLRDAKLDSAKRNERLDALREQMKGAVADKRLMGLGTPPEVTVPGVPPTHAYAIVGYDAKTDMLTIWNPHGNEFNPKGAEGLENGYKKKDGFFKAPFLEVVQWAGMMFFETDKPAPPPKKK